MNEYTWSQSEKKIARQAFDLACERECQAIRRDAEAMLRSGTDDRVVWRVHAYLSEKRRQFDNKYDYRYSQLIFVFGLLVAEKWLTMEDLAGLREEKLESIQRISSFR